MAKAKKKTAKGGSIKARGGGGSEVGNGRNKSRKTGNKARAKAAGGGGSVAGNG